MCSESLPKEFEKTTEVLPFTKYGLSTAKELKQVGDDLQHLEWLKKAGLTSDEIKLYQENEAGLLDQRKKIESGVLKTKLEEIYNKINNLQNGSKSFEQTDLPGSSKGPENLPGKQQNPISFYPEGHPMNQLKELEQSMFGRIKTDIIPITKRRKMLRRLERKKERLLIKQRELDIGASSTTSAVHRPESLWDVKVMPPRAKHSTASTSDQHDQLIGPKKRIMYTIKDNKILRLAEDQEPKQDLVQNPAEDPNPEQVLEDNAVDNVMPINPAEAQLLEGTKMCVDDIRKIPRFKDYEPGQPSKTICLKNIAPAVSQEQISLLFNQFIYANGGPVNLRIFSGAKKEAYVSFKSEHLAIQALEEVNGTIMGGQPVIAEFGRNLNRRQDDDESDDDDHR